MKVPIFSRLQSSRLDRAVFTPKIITYTPRGGETLTPPFDSSFYQSTEQLEQSSSTLMRASFASVAARNSNTSGARFRVERSSRVLSPPQFCESVQQSTQQLEQSSSSLMRGSFASVTARNTNTSGPQSHGARSPPRVGCSPLRVSRSQPQAPQLCQGTVEPVQPPQPGPRHLRPPLADPFVMLYRFDYDTNLITFHSGVVEDESA